MPCGSNKLKNKRNMSATNTFLQQSSTDNSNLQLMKHLFADQELHQQYYLKGTLITQTQSTKIQSGRHRELLKKRNFFQKEERDEELAFSDKAKNEPFRISNKKQICSQQRNFKSPKKTIKKFQISQNIVKKLNFKNKKIVQKSNDQKELIIKNIFYRENRYYYSDQVIFSEILKRIYYQSWKIDDIKNYIQPCFKVIPDQHEFFKILINEAKIFGNSVKNLLIKQIKKLLVGNCDSNSQRNFKKFNKNLQQYNHTIDCLHNHYKHLESVNLQIERLIQIYFQNFIKEKIDLREEELKCHRRIFINCVYNDSLVRDFITTFYQFLGKKTEFSDYYYKIFLQVEEIYENLELPSEMFNSSQSTEVHTITNCDNIYNYCSEALSDQIFSEENKNCFCEGGHHSLEVQNELKMQKKREKRRRKKERQRMKKQQEKMEQKKLIDQMFAIELEKKLMNISKEYKNAKFEKVKTKLKPSLISHFNSLINSF